MNTQQAKLRFTFRPVQRLLDGTRFKQIFDGRVSTSDRHLIIYAQPNGLGHCRLGLSVGRRLGNAVVRNRYKRTLREAFRLIFHELPGAYDLVVVPRSAAQPRTCVYQRSLLTLAGALDRRWRKTVRLTAADPSGEVTGDQP